MIALLLSMLCGFAQEDEASEEDTGEPVASIEPRRAKVETPLSHSDRKIRGIPLRLDMGTALRPELAPAFLLSLGAQLARTEHFALETNVGVMPMHALQYPGPWRAMMNWDFSADVTWLASRFVALGPTGGAHYRLFNQQGSAIGQMFVPIAGMRVNTAFIRARTWSFAITARLTSDLSLTRIVLETNEVRMLPLVEGQLGLRFNMGHGRVPEKKK